MQGIAERHARSRHALGAGVALSVAVHAAVLAAVGFRVPVGSTDEDVIRLVSSEPAAARAVVQQTTPRRPDETRVVRAREVAAAAHATQGAAGEAASSLTAVEPFRPAATPVTAGAAGDLAAAYQPLALAHPANGRTVALASGGAVGFSPTAAPAARSADAPPVHDRGRVGDAKDRWAEAAGVGAEGLALRVGFAGGGACGIPGPVTSWPW